MYIDAKCRIRELLCVGSHVECARRVRNRTRRVRNRTRRAEQRRDEEARGTGGEPHFLRRVLPKVEGTEAPTFTLILTNARMQHPSGCCGTLDAGISSSFLALRPSSAFPYEREYRCALMTIAINTTDDEMIEQEGEGRERGGSSGTRARHREAAMREIKIN